MKGNLPGNPYVAYCQDARLWNEPTLAAQMAVAYEIRTLTEALLYQVYVENNGQPPDESLTRRMGWDQ